MNPRMPGLGIISALMLAAVLTAWLGIAGPVDIARLQQWQTLIAGFLAIAAACIAFKAAMIKVNDDRAVRAAENARLRLGVCLRVDFATREIWNRADELLDLFRQAQKGFVDSPRGVTGFSIIEPPELEAVWDKLDLLPKHLISEVARVRLLIRTLVRMDERMPRRRVDERTVAFDVADLTDLVPTIIEIQDRCRFIHTNLVEKIEELSPSRKLFSDD